MWFGTYDGGISRFDGVSFTNFTKNDGLPSNRIQAVFYDGRGNIWIGTEDGGVARYDGNTFTTYSLEDGLLSNNITSIISDHQESIWVGTSKGVNIIKQDSVMTYGHNDELPSKYVLALMQSSDSTIWMGTIRGVLQDKLGVIDSLTTSQGLLYHYVNTMMEDSKGNVWLGTPRGVEKYDGKKHEHYIQPGGQAHNWIETIEEDKEGQIWVGTRGGGVHVLDSEGNCAHVNDKNGLNSNAVLSIMKDTSGVLWLGTVGGGINKHIGNTFVHFGKSEGMSHDLVFPIYQDQEEQIWLGTYGGGINRYEPHSGKMIPYNTTDGLSGDNVFSITQTKAGDMWVGTMQGINHFDGNKFVPHPKYKGVEIWSIQEDSKGNLWIGTQRGVVKEKNLKGSLYSKNFSNVNFSRNGGRVELSYLEDGQQTQYFNKSTGFSDGSVYTMIEDESGNMWFGTDDDGIYKYDGKNFHKLEGTDDISGNYVTSSVMDSQGALWFGTAEGLVLSVGDEVRMYTEVDGLTSNVVNNVLVADDGAVWIGTIKGVEQLIFDENYDLIDVASFGSKEGFTSIETNDGASLKDKDGNLWFGTINGATRVSPQKTLEPSNDTRIHLSKIKLFLEDVDWSSLSDEVTPWFGLPKDLILENDQNQLSFDFVGINMKVPDKIQYQWKLEGFDKDWSPITKKREAHYTNIPPGNYEFKVKATNEKGIWSPQQATFQFEILSPLWQRWWFILGAVVLFVLLMWLFISFRLRHINSLAIAQRETLEIERKMIASERKALRAQINPHFIFNVLNSIQYYIQDNEPLVASRYLSKFAKLMRMILDNSKSSSVPLSEELESLKLYMDLEILRTEYKFDYEVVIDDTIDTYESMIPPMLIQPFIENSIRHGITPIDRSDGRIKLEMWGENNLIMCVIEDNGIGINEARKRKNGANGYVSSGMQITGDRLDILNRNKASGVNVKITDISEEFAEQTGTRVEIIIPMES